MPNRALPEPPVEEPIVLGNGKASVEYRQWLGQMHKQISPEGHQKIIAASAVESDARYVALDSTAGAMAVTLSAPEVAGVYKLIEMTADGGDVTMSLANCVNGSAATTCTWNDVRDTLHLVSLSDKWLILTEYGVSLT